MLNCKLKKLIRSCNLYVLYTLNKYYATHFYIIYNNKYDVSCCNLVLIVIDICNKKKKNYYYNLWYDIKLNFIKN
ncbi:hypothetical protein PFMALIP_01461 [Plasmodium falciparum MaliPS096_E11]|uniref:Uncharacterized protein n=1 Tax=Plasmodium falciparum MaliPS096_E11 TaxID=1036727 RepID=A0A024WUQ5_PLAFA|nr:hypothetical protein PFMALIP_01461 [Plasmodium falciparum MaliPS096_E11]